MEKSFPICNYFTCKWNKFSNQKAEAYRIKKIIILLYTAYRRCILDPQKQTDLKDGKRYSMPIVTKRGLGCYINIRQNRLCQCYETKNGIIY